MTENRRPPIDVATKLDDAIFSKRSHPLMPERSLLQKLARLTAATGKYAKLDREIEQWLEDMRARGEI